LASFSLREKYKQKGPGILDDYSAGWTTISTAGLLFRWLDDDIAG